MVCEQAAPELLAALDAQNEGDEQEAPASLGREAILELDDLVVESVYVKEWNTNVLVRTLSSVEKDAWEASQVQGHGKNARAKLDNIRASLCVRCIVDENGDRMFGDHEAGALGKKSAKAVCRVFDVATELNGVSEKDVEDIAGN